MHSAKGHFGREICCPSVVWILWTTSSRKYHKSQVCVILQDKHWVKYDERVPDAYLQGLGHLFYNIFPPGLKSPQSGPKDMKSQTSDEETSDSDWIHSTRQHWITPFSGKTRKNHAPLQKLIKCSGRLTSLVLRNQCNRNICSCINMQTCDWSHTYRWHIQIFEWRDI